MVRIFTKNLLLSAAACLLATAAMANDYTDENGLEYTLNTTDKTASVARKTSGSYSGEVAIPSTVTSGGVTYNVTAIGAKAFYDCYKMTKITIPSSVKSIGSNAFYVGSSHRSKWGLNPANGGSGIHITDLNAWLAMEFDGQDAQPLYYGHRLYLNGEEVTEVSIPEGTTTINAYAFCGCSSITKISIPSSVTAIGESAFKACNNLADVYITDVAAWCNISFGNEYSTPFAKSGAHNLYVNNELVSDLVIPEGVTSISKYAFYYCMCLKSVTFPSTLTTIGANNFRGCDVLTTLTFNGTTPPTIEGDYTFGGSNISTVYVPSGCEDAYKSLLAGWTGTASASVTTGIAAVSAEQGGQDSPIYNLQGQRVTTMQKGGVYIKGGKKTLYK